MPKISSKFRLREIAGEHIVVSFGELNVSRTKIISLNESSAWLFAELSGREFEVSDAANCLVEKYGISAEQASEDAARWVDNLRKAQLFDE
ncbi:MAG: PqqD family protein [Mucinivorans sp.]